MSRTPGATHGSNLNQQLVSSTTGQVHFSTSSRTSSKPTADAILEASGNLRLGSEILTIEDVAALLKMKDSAVYEMTRHRAQVRHPNPIPVCRINGHIRFGRSDIEAWLERCVQNVS